MKKEETAKMIPHNPSTQKQPAIEQYLRLKYPMEIVEGDDGVVASIPDLPGCTSFGDTVDKAIQSLNEVKELWIKGRVESGQVVPEPSTVEDFSGKFVLRVPRTLHRSLDREAKRQGVSLNQYILHLLSERHAVSKLENSLQHVSPSLTSWRDAYLQTTTRWPAEGAITRYCISFDSSAMLDNERSLLAMLDFVPKPAKEFRMRVNQKQLAATYEG